MNEYISFHRRYERAKSCALQTSELEASFGPGSVLVSSSCLAFQMVLDLLGCRKDLIPVIMSVAAPHEVLAAVLRASGQPVLVDISEDTLQMDPEILASTLESFEKGAIVILDRPGGDEIDPELLEVTCNKAPTIVDSRFTPALPVLASEQIGDFCIYTLDSCAVIVQAYEEQQVQLKSLRSSFLGYYAHVLPMSKFTSDLITPDLECKSVVDIYNKLLKKPLAIAEDSRCYRTHVAVEVADVQRAMAHLISMNVQVYPAISPLHLVPAVRARFAQDDEPVYPVAEHYSTRILALPCHASLLENERIYRVCEYLNEVS